MMKLLKTVLLFLEHHRTNHLRLVYKIRFNSRTKRNRCVNNKMNRQLYIWIHLEPSVMTDVHLGTEITVNRIILKRVERNYYNNYCPSPLPEFTYQNVDAGDYIVSSIS